MAKSLLSLLISTSLLSSSLASQPNSGINDCFMSDQAYSGDAITNLTTGCSRECQRKCEGNEDCRFWTYSADSVGFHDCILFSSGNPVASVGKISGPKRCSEPYHCIHHGFEVGTSSLKVLNAPTEHRCQLECKRTSECAYANWTTDGKCHMKGSMLDNKYGMNNTHAMPRDCSEGWCYQSGHLECSGSDLIETVNEIPTAKKCQETCRLKNGCDLWTWNKNGDQKCRLMKLACYKRASIKKDENAFLGSKRCGTFNCHESYNYRGGDLRFAPADNAEQCNDICFQDPACNYFTYGIVEKKCWLKSAESLRGRIQNNNFISGPAICLGKATALQFDVDYVGNDMTEALYAPDEFFCAKECKSRRACSLFTFLPDRRECYVKKSSRGTRKSEIVGRISAPLEVYFDSSI